MQPQPDRWPPAYAAFLLRLWRVGGASAVWCASLQDPHTGVRQGFTNLAQLAAFLDKLTHDSPPEPPEPG